MAVRSLLDYALEVPDQTVGETFYRRFGLVGCTTDHHNVAFLTSRGPGFHPASFEVGSVDEIAMGALRMQEAGWQPGWGLGRHVIGSNFFHCIRDPWGSFAEYFHDLDYIPEQAAWEPRDFPEADALYRWGPPVPDDFGLNHEVEG